MHGVALIERLPRRTHAPDSKEETTNPADLSAFNTPVPRPRAFEYPFYDRTIAVTMRGRVCFGSRKINLSTVFDGQYVSVKEVEEKVRLISFMHYDLGFFDHESSRFECAENPFAAKVLPLSSE